MNLITETGARVNPSKYFDAQDSNYDLFNEMQVAEASPLIELKSNYGVSELRDRVATTGGGSVTNTKGEFNVSTAADGSSTVIFESAERGRYLPGLVGVPGIAVRIPAIPTGNQILRWGYFDSDDGFGYKLTSNGISVFVRKGGIDSEVSQSNWNDPLDGNGPSKIILDTSFMALYRFPFRWYGTGPVNFEMGLVQSDGFTRVTKAHSEATKDGEPFIQNPNLPLRAEVDNNGTATATDLNVSGRQYFVYGRYLVNQRVTSEHRLAQSVGTTNLVPLVSFRQKTDYNSVSVKLSGSSIITDAKLRIVALIGSSPDTPTWDAPSDVPATETALEFDTSATTLSANGIKQYEDLILGGSRNNVSSQKGLSFPEFDMPSDGTIITIAAIALDTAATVDTVFRAQEEW